jgi:hypothetical protein
LQVDIDVSEEYAAYISRIEANRKRGQLSLCRQIVRVVGHSVTGWEDEEVGVFPGQ